jgi:1,4-alpha-glucan branching enzyme
MDENNFLVEDEELSAPILKRVLTDQQKEAAKLHRQQVQLDRQQDPEEDREFKDRQHGYYANHSEEQQKQIKFRRVSSNAARYASRTEEETAEIKIKREETAVENNTEEQRAIVKQVNF